MQNFNLGIDEMSVIPESVTSENLCSMIGVQVELTEWQLFAVVML